MSEFEKRFKELEKENDPPCLIWEDVEKIIEEAKKELMEWWKRRPQITNPSWLQAIKDSLPNPDIYFVDQRKWAEATRRWVTDGTELLTKWFGNVPQ